MRLEDDADVELLAEGGLDADFDVVEVDEDGDVQAFLMRQNEILRVVSRMSASDRQRPAGVRPRFAAVEPTASGRGAAALYCSSAVVSGYRRGIG